MALNEEERAYHQTQPILGEDGQYRIVDPELYSFDALMPEIERMTEADDELSPEEALERIMQLKSEIWYTTQEAADYLGYEPVTVANLCQTDQIVATKTDDRYKSWRISEASLEEYRARVVKQRRPHSKVVNPTMNDDTTGFVSVFQASDYLDREPSYVRKLYRDGKLKGAKVRQNWLMLTAESVKEYKSNIKNGRYNPEGYIYQIVVTEDDLALLKQLAEMDVSLVRMDVRIPDKKTVKALRKLGLKVKRKKYYGEKKVERSPLELPERYQALLEKAQLEDDSRG